MHKSTTLRLSLSYLAVIMIMSLSFSAISYSTSYRQLGRQLPPPGAYQRSDESRRMQREVPTVEAFLENRISEARQALLIELATLNVGVLVAGSFVSFLLARRTLKPIEANVNAQIQFVTDASHELRTPLTSMLTANEIALKKLPIGKATTKQLIKDNIHETLRLSRLTDNLLSYASADATILPLKPVNAQELITDAVTAVAALAANKSITIDDSIDPVHVHAEAGSITQALVILLDNAIKYSPPNSPIYVNTRIHHRHVDISVRDMGIGIKKSDQPYIFDRFYRADSSRNNDQVAGFGIGLSLAQRIASQNNGTISFKSTIEKGSTFTITLQKSRNF